MAGASAGRDAPGAVAGRSRTAAFVKLTFAKNVYMKLQGEVGGGDVYPPTNGSPFQSWPGNIGATYLNAGNWNSTLSGTFYQANLNFVVSF